MLEPVGMVNHLCRIYKEVILPYNQEIYKIMIEKNLFTESDIFNINCAFTNIINSTDEKYGHEADIENILSGLREQLCYDIIEPYIKETKEKHKIYLKESREQGKCI